MHEHGGYLGDVIWIIYSLKLMCTHIQCLEQKMKFKMLPISFLFFPTKNHCIVHGHVFEMSYQRQMWPHQDWCGTGENDIAVLTCTHNQCFEQKYQNFQNISDDIFIFFLLKKSLYIVHGHVLVM